MLTILITPTAFYIRMNESKLIAKDKFYERLKKFGCEIEFDKDNEVKVYGKYDELWNTLNDLSYDYDIEII